MSLKNSDIAGAGLAAVCFMDITNSALEGLQECAGAISRTVIYNDDLFIAKSLRKNR